MGNDAPKEVKEDRNKEEVSEEVSEEAKAPSVFVTDDDVFDVTVRFVRVGGTVMVEGEPIDEETESQGFSVLSKKHPVEEFTITLKYPSQGDCEAIAKVAALDDASLNMEEMDIRNFMRTEFARFVVLVRKWSLKEKVNNGNLDRLHPKIVKGILQKIREHIGVDGII